MSTPRDLLKLNLPVFVVASLLSVAAGAGASYAAAKAQLSATADIAKEAKGKAEEAQNDVHQHAIDLAVIKSQMVDVNKSLERIEDALGTHSRHGEHE